MADQQNPGEQCQTTTAGHGQGHARTFAGIRTGAPETNQQERRQAGQLPEHQHQQQVFRQHHAEHGAHKQQEEGEEAPHRLLLRQVVTRVKNDQQANAENQQGKQKAQTIETQAEIQAQGR